MTLYLWVALGSAIGGCLRYALGRAMVSSSSSFPWSTILINVLGSFAIGFFGTLTLHGSRYAVSQPLRLFVMVGLCGGFTTFSAFSLETFDLLRTAGLARALANASLSVVLCVAAVALGHLAAQPGNPAVAVAETAEEKCAG